MLEKAGISKGYSVSREGSAISPSQYITFRNPSDDTGELTRQVRISNHADKYPELASGIRMSSDPITENTFEQAVNWLGKEGFPTRLSTKYSNIPSNLEKVLIDKSIREMLLSRLDGLISAWRNKPKATRGDMPIIDDAIRIYGEGNILKSVVRRGDVLDDITEPLGNEYIFRPTGPANKALGFDGKPIDPYGKVRK